LQVNEMTLKRLQFLKRMLAIYVSIIGGSTLVAVIRFSLNEDGSLHHFIATTSNHLVLARISASLLSWGGSFRQSLTPGLLHKVVPLWKAGVRELAPA
jgi:hypothetical protein